MATSPELTGGLGFTFEDAVTAAYLSALLRESNAQGSCGHIVTRVAQQQKDFGEPLDDVIVDFQAPNGDVSRLRLQVKRELIVSAAKTNTDFRAVVCEAYATVMKAEFRENRDRAGTATGTISDAKKRELDATCQWARASLSATSFHQKIQTEGHASDEQRKIVACFRDILSKNESITDLDEAVFRVLKHFILIRFDLLHEGATTEATEIASLRSCLHVTDASKAAHLWGRLRVIAREGAGCATEYDRVSLLAKLHGGFRFVGAPSMCANLEQITTETRQALSTIRDDIAGFPLARRTLVNEAEAKSEQHRFVQIVGVPGVGKSVILRRLVERGLEKGSVLLLKADRLAGNTWASYAHTAGLTPSPLRALLAEICHTGTAVLFIDGLDRIESIQRGIITDLLNAIHADEQLRQQWRVIATVRDNGIELLRNWLPPHMFAPGNTGLVTVEPLNDEEVDLLVKAKPELRHILSTTNTASEIARRPFFTAELVRLFSDTNSNQPLPRTETELIEAWWQRGGLSGEEAQIVPKQECLIKLANKYGQCIGRPVQSTGLNHLALHDLKNDGVIRDFRNGHTVTFCHDIFFEWSLFHAFLDQGEQWLDGLCAMGQAPAFGRVVELLSQDCYFSDGQWEQQLAQLETAGLRSQWTRAWMMAPICSPIFNATSAVFTKAILRPNSDRVKQLAVWFQAEKTIANPFVLTGNVFAAYPPHERIRLADELARPADSESWRNCCNWLLQNLQQCPVTAIPDILTLFEVWQNAFRNDGNDVSQPIVAQAHAWLRDIEERYHPEDYADRDDGKWAALEGRDAIEVLEKRLRTCFLGSSKTAVEQVRSYLQKVTSRPRLLKRVYDQIIAYSESIVAIAPTALANLVLARYLDVLPSDKLAIQARRAADNLLNDDDALNPLFREIGYSSPFSDQDWENLAISDNYSSVASPIQEPFAALFSNAPIEAHRLVRELSNHAICAWKQLNALDPTRGRTPIPLELDFPWGKQAFWGNDHEYLWFRGTWGPTVVRSSLMALEAWGFAQLENGCGVDQIIQEVVQGHDCCAVLGIAGGLALSKMHLSSATLPLAICQRLWLLDILRCVGDDVGNVNLICFDKPSHKKHRAAVEAGNKRAIRRIDIRQLAFVSVFAPAAHLREAAKAAITAFPQNLPFQFEEQKQNAGFIAEHQRKAEIWAEIGRGENHSLDPSEDSRSFHRTFNNPKLAEAAEVAQQREWTDIHSRIGLLRWAIDCLEKQQLSSGYTIAAALEQARALAVASPADMAHTKLPLLGNPVEIVAAVAAALIPFVHDLQADDRRWAEDMLFQVIAAPNVYNEWGDTRSNNPRNPKISAVKGLAASIAQGVRVLEAQKALLQAITNPSEEVSAAAIHAGLGLWDKQPYFAWLVLDSTIRVSIGYSSKEISAYGYGHDSNSPYFNQVASLAASWLVSPTKWNKQLVTLPPPWGEMFEIPYEGGIFNSEFAARMHQKIHLQEPDPFLRWDFLPNILTAIPVTKIMQSKQHKSEFLRFCEQLVLWTGERLQPSCLETLPPNERPEMEKANLSKWNRSLFHFLAYVALELDWSDAEKIILQPLNRLKEEIQAALLEPFINELSCIVMDRPEINQMAVGLLKSCVHRLMTFKDWHYAREAEGQMYDSHLSQIIRSICFVRIEHAKLAVRFANGNWQDIALLLPVFDPMIKTVGDIPPVTYAFLTLYERAIDHYPMHNFIEQVQTLLTLQKGTPAGWHGTALMSRLATLVQLFAEKNLPLEPSTAQAMLAILDRLVDMGNRRAAALQGSDSFRAVRVGVRQSNP
jgi:ATPase family associated with various cellular activities (AAA)